VASELQVTSMQEVGQAPSPWVSLHEAVGNVLAGLSKERTSLATGKQHNTPPAQAAKN